MRIFVGIETNKQESRHEAVYNILILFLFWLIGLSNRFESECNKNKVRARELIKRRREN
jgi:hypothetical protein